jgi:N-acetylneuraminic acid mutarotase
VKKTALISTIPAGNASVRCNAASILLKLSGPVALILLACLCLAAHAQTNEWAWMGGSSTVGSSGGRPGVYGTLGTPAAANVPGSRTGATSWTDSDGRLWLLGGLGYDASGTAGYLNDLWEFDPSTIRWAWMGGSNAVGINGGSLGIYGTLGQFAAENMPGSRENASSWTDTAGHLWLFGGEGYGAYDYSAGWLNDLWEFDPSTRQWRWVDGSNTWGDEAVWGKLGVPGVTNIPGSRWGASTWVDGSGNLWLFGGNGYGALGYFETLNDLWEFNPSTEEWTWMGGSSAPVYGKLRTPAARNIPGGRDYLTSWIDRSGHFWLFGGLGFDAVGSWGELNDLWEFDLSTREWAWMDGSSSLGNKDGLPGVYGILGTPAAGNVPGSRTSAASWTDSNGHLRLFGGAGYDADGNGGELNDFWNFNPSTNEWTWMGGSNTAGNTCDLSLNDVCAQPGVYGTLGTPAARNIPGGRYAATSWTDSSGNFWLFGGYGLGASATFGDLNDLWEYELAAAAPAFSVASGTYISPQTVKLSDVTQGAAIYYTLDTSTPTSDSTRYTAALTISENTTVKAIAEATGYANSAVATATYIILKAQTIAFTQPASPVTYGVKPITLSAKASSGLAVTFSVVSGPGKVSGTDGATLTITGAGTVVVAANQAGNADYAAAPQVKRSITVDKAAQSITFTQPASPVSYGVKPITLSAKASSGLAVIFSVISGPGRVSGTDEATLTITGAGTVVVAANQAGNTDYSAAAAVKRWIVVDKAAQVITFAQPATPVVYGVAPITLSATGGASANAVVFSIVSGPGTISGNRLTITGAGTVVVAANQAGNTDYSAAAAVERWIVVKKAALTVTANNLSMKRGASVPTLTYAMTGFVNGDTQAKATIGQPALSTTATSKSAAGSYPITVKAGTLAAADYTFTLVNGTLTVTN